MVHAVAAMEGHCSVQGSLSIRERQDFQNGVRQVLDFLERFWMGLELQRSKTAHTLHHNHSQDLHVTLGDIR